MRRRLKKELTHPDHLCVPTCLCVCLAYLRMRYDALNMQRL